MAIFACKCLNVKLESDKVEANVDVGNLELSIAEQRDIYFSEKLLLCASDTLKIQVSQPALVGQRFVGNWTVHSCLSCSQTTHAILQDKNRPKISLINKTIQTTHDHINNLKKSKNYSPVFNLLVPESSSDVEMKENMDTSNMIISDKMSAPPSHQVISSLSKLLSQTLESQLEAVEETVQQFRDQKYAEFEAYRERAQRDHKILSSIVSKAQSNPDNSWAARVNEPPSPHLPLLQRRRLSSIKDAKKLSHNIVKHNRGVPPEEDSLDAEDLFDLEGMDEANHVNSDLDDYDSDDVSDEGIQVGRARAAQTHTEIARSLPMNIAGFPADQRNMRELDEHDYEEPQDIAASIKALARSVHGDVFELPRPRFSTQI